LVIGFFLALNLLNFNRLPYGVTINNLKIGGASFAQADQALTQHIVNFDSQKLNLVFGDKSWLLSPRDLGIAIDKKATLLAAANFGHGSNLLAATAEQSVALFFSQNLPPVYTIDAHRLKQTISSSSLSAIEQQPIDAALKYNSKEKNFSVTSARTGQVINRVELAANIARSFNQPDKTISLALVEQRPRIEEADLTEAKNIAQTIIDNAPYSVVAGDSQSWKLEQNILGEWLETAAETGSQTMPQASLNQEKIKTYLTSLAKNINREATDAKLTWENDEIKFIFLAQPGQKLNIEASAAAIADGLLINQKNIQLVIDKTEPGISDRNISELGLTSLLGKGESNFAGSDKNRQFNIKIGATKLNGWLMKPGEEFSFVGAIGDIDAVNGWAPGYVIKNNQTIPEFGGGICQVSTTLFRAAIKAGLKITERQAHAYPVKYYGAPGFDATIYAPKPDLKILNNTAGHLLLQNKIEGTKLTFEIYGSSDGREVKVKGPTVLSKSPDGSMRTILTQEIWRDGQLAEKNDFRSNYKSADLYPVVTASPSPSPSVAP
jgi:vancomycin resistance protein YoaR